MTRDENACCPNCGHRLPSASTAPIVTLEQLVETCRASGLWIGPGSVVREEAAAELIGWSLNTARNRRYSDAPIPHSRRAGRVVYRLADIADFLRN